MHISVCYYGYSMYDNVALVNVFAVAYIFLLLHASYCYCMHLIAASVVAAMGACVIADTAHEYSLRADLK